MKAYDIRTSARAARDAGNFAIDTLTDAREDKLPAIADRLAFDLANALGHLLRNGVTLNETTRDILADAMGLNLTDIKAGEVQYMNHYTCPKCSHAWTDTYSCMVDDDCPECGCRHISPVTSEEVK